MERRARLTQMAKEIAALGEGKYPIKHAGYTMQSPNHFTYGTPKPLADDWISPAESYTPTLPQFDFLNRMDVWDADFKKEVGFFPSFSRLARLEDEIAALPEGTVYLTPNDFMPRVKSRKDAF